MSYPFRAKRRRRQLGFHPRSIEPIAIYEVLPDAIFDDENGASRATDDSDVLGAVLDSSRGLVRGPELLTNGDFSDGTNDWSMGEALNFSVTGGVATLGFDVNTFGNIYQQIQANAGDLIEISTDVVSIVDVLEVRITLDTSSAGNGNGATRQTLTVGANKFFLRAPVANPFLAFKLSSGQLATGQVSLNSIQSRVVSGNHLKQSTSGDEPTLDLPLGSGRENDLVVNGGFDIDLSSWTDTTGGDWSWSNGRASDGGTASGSLRQGVPTVVGETYEITATAYNISGGNPSVKADSTVIFTFSDGQDDVTLSGEFTATSTSTIVELAGTLATWEVDNVTVRKIKRDGPRGMRFDGVSQFLDATGMTADSGPKTVIAGCITDDGELNDRQFLLDAETGRQISAAVGPTAGAAAMFDGNWSGSADYDTEALSVITFKHWASGGGIRVNGAVVTSENQTEVAFGGSASVGSQFAGSFDFLKGVIYIILFFDKELTADEIQMCEIWVAARLQKLSLAG